MIFHVPFYSSGVTSPYLISNGVILSKLLTQTRSCGLTSHGKIYNANGISANTAKHFLHHQFK